VAALLAQQAGSEHVLTPAVIAAAPYLPEDEREHLSDVLERRWARGEQLTRDDAHEALGA
jgi:hypothetical protein